MYKTIVIDLDDTLLLYPEEIVFTDIEERYRVALPNLYEIKKLKNLKKMGYRIIIHSGRSWTRYEITLKQIKEFKIPYDEIVLGKPLGIYVDRDAITTLKDLK